MVTDPKELHTSSRASLLIITKVSAPSQRAPSLSFSLLICDPLFFDVPTSLTGQGNLNSFYSILLLLSPLSSFDTFIQLSSLFNNLSSFVLLSSAYSSPTQPSSAFFFSSWIRLPVLHPLLSFLHVFAQLASLAWFYLHLFWIFFSSTLLDQFSSHLISSSSGCLLSGPFFISTYFFPLTFHPPPLCTRGVYSTILSGSMHISPSL
jgi:hypothetical protein